MSAWPNDPPAATPLDDALRAIVRDVIREELAAVLAQLLPPRVGLDDGRLTVTAAEAAELLGVSAKTVYRMVESGELRAMRAGRSVRVPVVEVERLLAGRVS